MSNLVDRARLFAIEKHKGMMRSPESHKPYHVHPQAVAELITAAGGTEAQIAAGWVHDVPEDTDTTLAEVEDHLGKEVADIVDGLTDPPELRKLPTLERKKAQAERVKNESDLVKEDKLADQTCNLRDTAANIPATWSHQKAVDYVQGCKLVGDACRGINAYLDAEFDRAYKAAVTALAIPVS